MEIKKSMLSTAIVAAMGGVSMSAQAALSSTSSLQFDPGFRQVTSCLDGSDPATGCDLSFAQVTDMGGSYFKMDQGNGNADKVAISEFAPLNLGTTQTSSGQHTGLVDGSENPSIDNAWNFFFNTGMHNLSAPISVINDDGTSIKSLDFSGWGVNWGNFGPGGTDPTISLPGTATIVCSTASCSDSSTYVLDMDVHVPVAFGSVPYSLHMEGHVNAVPVPAAAWLFGSGVVGLAGVARRRRNKKA